MDGMGGARAGGEHVPRGKREFSYESSSAMEEGPSVELNADYYDDNVSDEDSDYDSDVVSVIRATMDLFLTNQP